jgi:hypothetical protein
MTSGWVLTQTPRAATVPQQWVEPGPVLAGAKRVDPHKHAIDGEKSRADLRFRLLGIEHRLGGQTDSAKR